MTDGKQRVTTAHTAERLLYERKSMNVTVFCVVRC